MGVFLGGDAGVPVASGSWVTFTFLTLLPDLRRVTFVAGLPMVPIRISKDTGIDIAHVGAVCVWVYLFSVIFIAA